MKEYCEKLNELASEMIRMTDKIVISLPNKEPNKFLCAQIYQISGAHSSMSFLLRLLENSPHHINQIFLILRQIITSTVLTYWAILESLKEDNQDLRLEQNIQAINKDHLDNVKKFLRSNATDVLNWNQSETESKVSLIDDKLNQLKFNPNFSSSFIKAGRKIIQNESNQTLKNEFKFLIERWNTFSKIEHPGYITLQLFKDQFDIKKKDESIRDIQRVIKFSIEQQILYYSLIGGKEADKLKRRNKELNLLSQHN